MDVLVMLEDRPEHSTVLAHVNSVPSPLNSERPSRDVVTLYGDATPESTGAGVGGGGRGPRETHRAFGYDSPRRAVAGARCCGRCGVAG